MHLYMLTRGKGNFVRRFIEDLETIFLPYKLNGIDHNLQLIARPVQLWEIAFPEGSKDDVISMIGNDGLNQMDEKGSRKPDNKWIPWLIGKLVKKLGLTKIPVDIKQTKPKIERQNVGVHLIGMKNDLHEPVVNERI